MKRDYKPTLITLYRLTYPGYKQVQQYYQYNFSPDGETVKIDSCPGCGKNLKYSGNSHKCDGRLTPNPVDTTYNGIGETKTKKHRDQALRHYIVNSIHPIQLSD